MDSVNRLPKFKEYYRRLILVERDVNFELEYFLFFLRNFGRF